MVEALRRFDTQLAGRRMALLVSDGLDVSHGFRSASPFQSIDLDRAISEAQRRGVVVLRGETVITKRFGSGKQQCYAMSMT
jgi:hypothetical protein